MPIYNNDKLKTTSTNFDLKSKQDNYRLKQSQLHSPLASKILDKIKRDGINPYEQQAIFNNINQKSVVNQSNIGNPAIEQTDNDVVGYGTTGLQMDSVQPTLDIVQSAYDSTEPVDIISLQEELYRPTRKNVKRLRMQNMKNREK